MTKKLSPIKIKHAENPFITDHYTLNLKTRSRIVSRGITESVNGKRVLMSGAFIEEEEIDADKFIKIYSNTASAFLRLSKTGAKIFEAVLTIVQSNPNKDLIYIHYSQTSLSEAAFYRGISELIEKEIIARHTLTHYYYISHHVIWNGDRVSFIKTFRKKKENDSNVIESLPLFTDDTISQE